MNLHTIREQRAAKVQEMRSLLAKAESEKRNLTQPEQAGFDKLKGEITALEADEQRANFLAEAERRQMGTPVDRPLAELQSQINVADVIRSQMEGRALSGAAAEYHKEAERRTGRAAQGVFLPLQAFEKRVSTTTTAAPIVPDDYRADQFIGPLRNSLLMRRLGARVLSNLRGDVVIPKFGTGLTAHWVNENEAIPESDMTFDDPVTLKPRHVGAITELSRQLLQQANPSIDAMVRDDISFVIAEAFDRAMLSGDGIKEPLGLLNTPGIQTASLATLDWPAVVAVSQMLADVNVTPNAWLASPSAASKLRTTLKAPTAGAGYLLEGGNLDGVPVYSTNQFADASAEAGQAILGDFSQMMIGVWSEIDLLINPYADATYRRGGVLIRAMMTADVAVRRPEAFVLANDVAI